MRQEAETKKAAAGNDKETSKDATAKDDTAKEGKEKKKKSARERRREQRAKEKLTSEDLKSASYAQRFMTDDAARLKVALADARDLNYDTDYNQCVQFDALNECPQESVLIIRHLSHALRRDPRIPFAPRAWVAIQSKLAYAFLNGEQDTATVLQSAAFHFQHAIHGIEIEGKLSPLHSDRSRLELESAHCFNLLGDALADLAFTKDGESKNQRNTRIREAARRQTEMAQVSLIHALEQNDTIIAAEANEQLGISLLRRMHFNKESALLFLQDATAALADACTLIQKSATESQVDTKRRILGRLVECYLAQAQIGTDSHPTSKLNFLKNASNTTDTLQTLLDQSPHHAPQLARTHVACAFTLAAQLHQTNNTSKSSKYLADTLNSIDLALKSSELNQRPFDRVALYCLEARAWHLQNSLDDSLKSLENAYAELCTLPKNEIQGTTLWREVARALASLRMQKAEHILKRNEEEPNGHRLLLSAVKLLEDIDSIVSSAAKNYDAICVCAVDLAHSLFRVGRFEDASTTANRAIDFAFILSGRSFIEEDTTLLDNILKLVDRAADLGVSAIAQTIKHRYADRLKSAGAWLWLPDDAATSQKRDYWSMSSPSNKEDTLEQKTDPLTHADEVKLGWDLLRFLEAKRAIRQLANLAPIILERLKNHDRIKKLQRSLSQLRMSSLQPLTQRSKSLPLATGPMPIIENIPDLIPAGNLAELANPVPTVLRAATTSIHEDMDTSKVMQQSEELIAEWPRNDAILAHAASLLNLPDKGTTILSDNEAILSWSVGGRVHNSQSLVGLVLLCASNTPRCGIFFSPWDANRACEFDRLTLKLRCGETNNSTEAALRELTGKLGINVLARSLPARTTRLALVLPSELAYVPVHALPISIRASEKSTSSLGARYVIRYGTSIAALSASTAKKIPKTASKTQQLAVVRPSSVELSKATLLLEKSVIAASRAPTSTLHAEQIIAALSGAKSEASKELKGANGVQMIGLTASGDHLSTGSSLSLTSSSLARQPTSIFENSTLIVLVSGSVTDRNLKTISIVDALISAGASAVIAPLWSLPAENIKATLIQMLFVISLWQNYSDLRRHGGIESQAASSAAATSLSWLRTVTQKSARIMIEDLPLGVSTRQELKEAFDLAFRGLPEDAAIANDLVYWGRYACFGDARPSSAPSSVRRQSKRQIVATEEKSSSALSLSIPKVLSISTTIGTSITKKAALLSSKASKFMRDDVSDDDETDDAAENSEYEDDDDDEEEMDAEVRAWVEHCETLEGRRKLEELGFDRALRNWTMQRRKRQLKEAAATAVHQTKVSAVNLAHITRENAIAARIRFREAGGDEAVARAKENLRKGKEKLMNTSVAVKARENIDAQCKKIASSATVRRACVLRTKFRDAGGDQAVLNICRAVTNGRHEAERILSTKLAASSPRCTTDKYNNEYYVAEDGGVSECKLSPPPNPVADNFDVAAGSQLCIVM